MGKGQEEEEKKIFLYSGRDEKIGKKDQQDCRGSKVERKALWKKIGLGRHQKAG